MPYRAPVSELKFVLDKVVGFDRVAATDRFAEATPETVDAILTEAGRMCEEVLAPLNRAGDLHPAHLENGVVRTSPGFAEGFAAIAEGGWLGMSADPDYGGMGLPIALTMAVNEVRHDEPDRTAGRVGCRRAALQGGTQRRWHLCGDGPENLHQLGRQRFFR